MSFATETMIVLEEVNVNQEDADKINNKESKQETYVVLLHKALFHIIAKMISHRFSLCCGEQGLCSASKHFNATW